MFEKMLVLNKNYYFARWDLGKNDLVWSQGLNLGNP